MAKAKRVFTPQFKSQVVLELLSGRKAAELCREHQIQPQLLATWRQTLLEKMPQVFGEAKAGEVQSQKRIDELERLLGRQALEIEILKKASTWLTGRSPTDGRSS
jgi:transposase-like protein